MCWPEADGHWDIVQNTIPTFEDILKNISGYKLMQKEEDGSKIKYRLFCDNPKGNTTVIIVDLSSEVDLRNHNAVSIFTDIESLSDYILSLPETKIINENIQAIRHIIYEDQVLMALKHNFKYQTVTITL